MHARIILWLVFFIFLFSGASSGAEDAASNTDKSEPKPWVRKVAFGILAHDIGPVSDNRESGVDPNWEVQFNPPEWRWWRRLSLPYDRRYSELQREHERFLSRPRVGA